jgi:FkbM family methyltransferase
MSRETDLPKSLAKPDFIHKLRRTAGDAVTGVCAHLPGPVNNALFHHFRRPVLWLLFPLRREEVLLTRVGPPGERFQMCLPWQGNPGLFCVLGMYETQAIKFLCEVVRPGYCCIDIGANLDYHALLMARLVGPSGQVIAFEPFPLNFQTLQKNVSLNDLQNVRLEPMAIGETSGSLSLFFAAEEENSATPSATAYAVHGRQEKLQVPMLSLDGYLSTGQFVPNLIKIDVEGAELSVLEGARRTLATVRPILLVEIHGWGTEESERVLHVLSEYHYDTCVVERKGRERIVLCTRRESMSRNVPTG